MVQRPIIRAFPSIPTFHLILIVITADCLRPRWHLITVRGYGQISADIIPTSFMGAHTISEFILICSAEAYAQRMSFDLTHL
jgi:hypothetical protein